MAAIVAACVCASAEAQRLTNDFSNSNEPLKIVGRGDCSISDGVFRSRSAYGLFGEADLSDYSVSFRARAPKGAEQVQIWAGFRAYNRFDRYVVGIKGGLQDDLYLMRLGYMGTDEFMGVRPLGFHPVPGEWYKIRIEVCGSRIRVFLNDENVPRIDLVDKNSKLAPRGGITLGGGWIDTEFDDLAIEPLEADHLAGVAVKEFAKTVTPEQKASKRRAERAKYKAITLTKLNAGRTELSLDGSWLFMPDYELADKDRAVGVSTADGDWHVMSVPDFWTPIRIWLHGETMPSPTGPQPKGVSDTYYQRETDRCEGYTFDYRRPKSAWYRQWVELPAGVEGKQMTLTFDAVSRMGEVYINGSLAGTNVGMFGEINVDGSKLLKAGRNLVAVKVSRHLDNSKSSAEELDRAIDFYYSSVRQDDKVIKTGGTAVTSNILNEIAHGFYGDNPAGIWQPVRLTITEPVRVEDVFIKPALDGAEFDVALCNHGGEKRSFALHTDIVDRQTGAVLYSGISLAKTTLAAGEQRLFTYSIAGLKPRLWTPQHPNLYDFTFHLVDAKETILDRKTETSGFRTFTVKDGFFELNGVRYSLRGGNHTPFALAPNDLNLANTFYQLMKAGNIEVTRTHTTPYNKLWMSAADRNGVGISFEGTWSWLMIHDTMPAREVIDMWAKEFLGLLRKYRNHPSLLFWTVNNEMKFYDNDSDTERAKQKMEIISNVVREMRKIDPTRPICFDSNYQAKGKAQKFGADFMSHIDDGDIDDVHGYYNWYDFSLFRFFNGEFQQFKMADRPLISQEMSTGYPNNETGHPTRSYQLIHQNPQTLIGYESYDWADPSAFLNTQAFITGELAEAFRRSNDRGSGTLHFALLTWFRQAYDHRKIEPYPTYYALKRALQPVLVSAELWGRNLYAGEKLPTRIYVVNDREDGSDLQPTLLRWELRDEAGRPLARGERQVPAVKHYERLYVEPEILIPERLPADKIKARLVLTLTENGLPVSTNEYSLVLANRKWSSAVVAPGKKIALLSGDGQSKAALESVSAVCTAVSSVREMVGARADLCVVSSLSDCTEEEAKLIRTYQVQGGKLLILNSKEVAKRLYPEYITGWITPTEGDIVTMERDDAAIFNGIGTLELRYFNNNRREIPTACNATFKVNRGANLTELAGQAKIHAYIDGGTPEDRIARIDAMRGFPLVQIADGRGVAIVSTMCTEKSPTDPIAGRLLANMIGELLK